jgi:hypothetical protein
MLDNDKLIYQNEYVSDTKKEKLNQEKKFCLHTTQHVSGMRIFLDIKLCARARNVPRLDGLDFIKHVGVVIC